MNYIYLIQNKINNKIYVGQTISPKIRWRQHKFEAKSSKRHLYKSIRKHGIENFSFQVIEEFDSQIEVDEAEEFWIQYFQTLNQEFGYNFKSGGNSSSGWKRKPFTKEHKQKLSESHKGQISAMTGKKHTEETKLKMRKPHKISDENKKLMSERGKLLGLNNKPSIVIDKEKEIIELYNSGKSIMQIAKIINCQSRNYISDILKNNGFNVINKGNSLHKDTIKLMKQLRKDGLLVRQICEQLNVSKSAVVRFTKEKE